MSIESLIEWTDMTWNFLAGCLKCSLGCKNCYAIREAWRLAHNPNTKISSVYAPTVKKEGDLINWTGEITLIKERLKLPLSIKSPKKIFVNSMSDLFHEDVPFWFVHEALEVMEKASWHTYQILTKRPENLVKFFCDSSNYLDAIHKLTNCWFGISAENQQRADERIPQLLQVPAKNLFLSLEPLLGPVDISKYLAVETPVQNIMDQYIYDSKIRWVIVGGESGPNAWPLEDSWVCSLRDQCKSLGVSFFYKQKIENKKKVSLPLLDGKQWAEMPEAR